MGNIVSAKKLAERMDLRLTRVSNQIRFGGTIRVVHMDDIPIPLLYNIEDIIRYFDHVRVENVLKDVKTLYPDEVRCVKLNWNNFAQDDDRVFSNIHWMIDKEGDWFLDDIAFKAIANGEMGYEWSSSILNFIMDERIPEELFEEINFATFRKKLGTDEALAAIAEECTELAKEALKLRRAMTQCNPTPVSVEEATNHFLEEMTDVKTALNTYGVHESDLQLGIRHRKIQRQQDRFKEFNK